MGHLYPPDGSTMKSLGPRDANWDLGATGQKWSLKLESLNFCSGCMERKVARSLGKRGLQGLPAGVNAETGTTGPRLDSAKPQD